MDLMDVAMKKAKRPFHHADYHPELEDTPFPGPALISRYQQLIGILWWNCEIGRLDILQAPAIDKWCTLFLTHTPNTTHLLTKTAKQPQRI